MISEEKKGVQWYQRREEEYNGIIREKRSTLTLREYNNVRGEKRSTMISEKRRGAH